jgi:hypothetical protein
VLIEKFREDAGGIYSSQAPMSRSVIHSWRKYEDSCDGGLGKVGWCVGDGGAPPSLTREHCSSMCTQIFTSIATRVERTVYLPRETVSVVDEALATNATYGVASIKYHPRRFVTCASQHVNNIHIQIFLNTLQLISPIIFFDFSP